MVWSCLLGLTMQSFSGLLYADTADTRTEASQADAAVPCQKCSCHEESGPQTVKTDNDEGRKDVACEQKTKILIQTLQPQAAQACSEGNPSGLALKEGDEEPSKVGTYSPHYFIIEPRVGYRFQFENKENRSALEAGASLRYPLPFWGQRLRVGFGMDWVYFEKTKNMEAGGAYRKRLTSLPMLFELDCSFMELGLWRPFFGAGLGLTRTWLTLDVHSYTYDPNETNDLVSTVKNSENDLAASVWGGCAFNVFYGGPFLKIRYMWSEARFIHLAKAEDMGGLSMLVGYHWEY